MKAPRNGSQAWTAVRIGDIGRVVTGKTPPTVRQELFGEQYPFITPTDIDGGARMPETDRFLSEAGRAYQRNLLLPERTIGFVCIGATIGKACLTDRPSFTNQQLNSVIVDRTRHDPDFVYYALKHAAGEIKARAGGAATPIVSKALFSDFRLIVPELDEQRRIAAILSAYDELIENNSRRIAILEEMARTLYREWFVHFRFPGHEKVRMVDSALGKIPEGWAVKPLREICELVMGQSPKSEFYNEDGDGLPFHQGVSDFGDHFPVDRIYCTALNRVAEEDDVLFSVRAPVGRINVATKRIVIGRGLCAVRNRESQQNFTLYQLKDRFGEEDMMGGGTIFKAVTKRDVEEIRLLVPGEPWRSAFETHATPLRLQMRALTLKNANLRTTRDFLLPKLVSGEIDVSDLDIAVPESSPETPAAGDAVAGAR
jgi:type I restriction enzyme S subunit